MDSNKQNKWVPHLALISLLIICESSYATDPRSYINVPIGTQLLQLGPGQSKTNTSVDLAFPVPNLHTDVDILFYRYAYYFDVFGQIGGVTVYGDYANLDFDIGEKSFRETTGLTDPTIMFGFAFFGSPALTPKEFMSYKLDTSLVLALYLTTPWGKYDKDKIINLGSNRWSLKPELALNKSIGKAGQINLYANMTGYGDNDDYRGNSDLSQDPKYGLEAYYSQNLSQEFWASVGTTWYYGGETQVNGVNQDNKQDDHTYTLSGNWLATPQNMITLSYYHNFDSSSVEQATILLRWMYLFGGYADYVKDVERSKR